MIDFQKKLVELIGKRKTLVKFDLVLAQHPDLLDYLQSVMQQHACDLSQALHLVLHGLPSACQYGMFPKFVSYQKGYNKFCGIMRDCKCARENMSSCASARSDTQRNAISLRRMNTNLARFGCENPSQSPDIRQKTIASNLEKYGAPNPQQNSAVRAKTAATNTDKYGVDTVLRAASPKRTHINHALKTNSSTRLEKTHATMLARYNVSNPSQIDGISEKKKQTYQTNWGSDHFMKSDQGRDLYLSSIRSKYNIDNIKQRHLHQDTIEILQNPEKFKSLAVGKTLKEIADLLGINMTTAGKKVHEFGLADVVVYRPAISAGHAEMGAWLTDIGVSHINNDRTQISPKELDIWIPQCNLAIEYCGVYWHGEICGKKARGDHKLKYDQCRTKGIDLITVYEPEWINQKNAVKNLILNRLKKFKKLYSARMLAVIQMDSHKLIEFYTENHMQGPINGYSLALVDDANNTVHAAATFGSNRFDNHGWELYRFASSGSIPGAFSKLLSSFCKSHNPASVTSYVNHRFNAGTVYHLCGFRYTGTTLGYQYVDRHGQLHHRQHFQKHKLIQQFDADPLLTEWQIMQDLGYDRIWDCGQSKYVLDQSVIASLYNK